MTSSQSTHTPMTTKDFNLKTVPTCSMWVPSLLSTTHEAAKPIHTHRCRVNPFGHDPMSSTCCEIIPARELPVVLDSMFDLILNSSSNPNLRIMLTLTSTLTASLRLSSLSLSLTNHATTHSNIYLVLLPSHPPDRVRNHSLTI